MHSSLVVPDASVLLKWVLPSDEEPDALRAVELRDTLADETMRAMVPALWLFEVGNTVARRFPAQAEIWLAAMMKFGLEEAPPTQAWMRTALELTRRHNVPFHDAAYHAVALVHDGLFVTADLRYVERTRKSGAVVALSNWRR